MNALVGHTSNSPLIYTKCSTSQTKVHTLTISCKPYPETTTIRPQKKKKKKKTLFYRRNRPKFSIFFFIFPYFCCCCFQNLVKSAIFWPKSKNFSWKFLKISQNIFPKLFCKKCQIYFFSPRGLTNYWTELRSYQLKTIHVSPHHIQLNALVSHNSNSQLKFTLKYLSPKVHT